MPENVRSPILKGERKTTKVGESIALELGEHILYMPERYSSLQDDVINEMVDGKFSIHKSNAHNEGNILTWGCGGDGGN